MVWYGLAVSIMSNLNLSQIELGLGLGFDYIFEKYRPSFGFQNSQIEIWTFELPLDWNFSFSFFSFFPSQPFLIEGVLGSKKLI